MLFLVITCACTPFVQVLLVTLATFPPDSLPGVLYHQIHLASLPKRDQMLIFELNMFDAVYRFVPLGAYPRV
jgi:hypothetical protein